MAQLVSAPEFAVVATSRLCSLLDLVVGKPVVQKALPVVAADNVVAP